MKNILLNTLNLLLAIAFTLCLDSFVFSQVVYSDGTFLGQGWEDVLIVFDNPQLDDFGPLTSTATLANFATGGNPNLYRGTEYELEIGDWVFAGGINPNWSYDPSLQGAISNLSFAYDGRYTINGSSSGDRIMLIALQNGQLFYSVVGFTITPPNRGWLSIGSNQFGQQDFDTNPTAIDDVAPRDGEMPDFSSNGAPILFGYLGLNGIFSGSPTQTTFSDIDNFSITVNPIVGDINCDGIIDLLDVQPFVVAIIEGVFSFKADINADGTVNLEDVAPFVALLTN